MALVGRRSRGYPKILALFRFLFAPALLAVVVLAGHGRHRPPAPPRGPAAVQEAPALSTPGPRPPEGAERGPDGGQPRAAGAARAPR